MSEKIKIYTDGACLGNPGAGGWGAILLYKEHCKKISGYQKDTTNNQMEMRAVIEALKIIKKSSSIMVYTDSKYVQNGISEWIHSWKKNGWKNSHKKPIKNIELWRELDEYSSRHQIEWLWVKGHNGDKYNEMADQLACEAANKAK